MDKRCGIEIGEELSSRGMICNGMLGIGMLVGGVVHTLGFLLGGGGKGRSLKESRRNGGW